MATLESLTPHIYLLLDIRSKHFDSPDDVHTVGLHVNGVSSVFMMFLPTSDLALALLTEHKLLQWVELAEGDELRACDLQAGQRDLVVAIVRAYRACFFQLVSALDVGMLFRLVVEAAMALDDHEPADEVLKELVEYIHETFPKNVLDGRRVDDHKRSPSLPVHATAPLPQSLAPSVSSGAAVDVKNETDVLEDSGPVPVSLPSARSDVASTPHLETTPSEVSPVYASIPSTRPAPALLVAGMRVRRRYPLNVNSTTPGIMPSLHAPGMLDPILPTAVAAERYIAGNHVPSSHVAVSDGDGWESDDSCPSLKSVADSSDGEEDQDLMSGMRAVFEADIADFLASLRRD